MMKRILSFLLVLCLCCAVCTGAFAEAAVPALQCNADGSFKILVVADTQDDNTPQPAMLKLLNAALDSDTYNLVIFLGDQVHGPTVGNNEAKTFAAIDAVVQPVADRNLPFAVVFGNHDDEGGVSKEAQMAHYQTYAGCLAVEGEEMTGCGNYALTVTDSKGSDAFCLWFFDSNTYDTTGVSKYDWVHEDQLAWFNSVSAAQAAANGGKALPGYVFQHIQVPEVYTMLQEVPKGTAGAVQGSSAWKNHYYTLNSATCFAGTLGEGPCPPDYNGGEFAAWQENGSIVASFFGHDHVNDFAGTLNGIDLVAVPGSTFYIYGSETTHGVRTITLHEDNAAQYDTEVLYYQSLVGEPLPGGVASTLGTYIQSLIIGGVCALLAVIAAVCTAMVLLVRHYKKKKATVK